MTRVWWCLLLVAAACAPRRLPPPSPPPLTTAQRAPEPAPTPPPPTTAALLAPDDPAVQAALAQYLDTGKAPLIEQKAAGFVQYPFGLSQPTVTCRPLELCDIELQPGEEILDLAAGDQERWVLQPLRSGPSDRRTVHVMVKPTDVTQDMQTTIVIGTTLRTYRIRLLSRRRGAIVNARFYYPAELVQHFQADQRQPSATVAVLPPMDLAALDDRYTIEGEAAWKPRWVANDGTRTYLKMPPELRASDAPVLFLQQPSGATTLATYRVKGGYYVVDALFDRAVLTWGVGKQQQTVTIARAR